MCRLVGDLIYLDVETLEGQRVCITGTTRTFYVNSSLGGVLDPRPTKNSNESFTLIGLLQKVSSKFKKGTDLVGLEYFSHTIYFPTIEI